MAQEDEQTLGQMFQNANDPAALDEFASLRQAQDTSLAQHEAYRQRLGQAEAQTQERQSDLAMTSRIYQLLDPNTPKAARSFLYGETAKALGLDPKAANTAEIGKVLTSLDPQSAAAVRTMIGQGIREAQPGDARKMYAAIFKGDVPMSDIISRAQQAAQASAAENQAAVAAVAPGQQEQEGMVPDRNGRMVPAGMMRVGGPEEDTTGPSSAPTTTADPARLPPLQRPAPPGLVARLGLDPARPWTIQDLVERGYTGPTDEEGINKFLRGDGQKNPGLEGRDASFGNLAGNFVQMESIIRRGGRGVLRWHLGTIPIPGTHGIELGLPTQSELSAGFDDVMADSFPDIRNPRETADRNLPRNDATRTGDEDLTSRQRFWSRQAARAFAKDLPAEAATDDPNAPASSPAQRDAENRRMTAQLESLMKGSLYDLGRIAGQSGQAFSNVDAANFQTRIGASTDPQARIQVLRDTFAEQYNKILQERNGIPLDMGMLTPEQRGILLNSTIVPEALRNQIQAYNNREAGSRAPVQTAAAAGPQQAAAPAQAPAANTAAAPTQPESGQPPTQQAAPAQAPAANTPATPPTEPTRAQPPAGMNRAEREQWITRQRAAEDRQFRLVQMQAFIDTQLRAQNAEGRAQETFERGSPFQRQEIARRQMERAQDKFQAAMSKVAAMLAGSGGRMQIPRSGGDGGGQDARAFQIPQKPQRTPPRIGSPRTKRGGD